MMDPRHKKIYGMLLCIAAVLLIAAQALLSFRFEQMSDEIRDASRSLEAAKTRVSTRHGLLEHYKKFEALADAHGASYGLFPENALELFTVVDKAMKENHVEHTNRSSTSGAEPGGVLQLQISFSGSYYGVLSALAALRDSRYVMRITDLRITAEDDGKVSGAMTIMSAAKKI